MFDQSSFSSFRQILAKATKVDYLLFSLFILGCLLVLYGMSLVLWGKNQSILVSANSDQPIVSSVGSTPQVIVEVAGAVNQPGIFTLSVGARIGQALEKAGGLTTDADSQFVAQQLHLAQTVKDGDKIYIPSVAERVQTAKIANQSSSASGSDSSKISINQADKKQLTSLPGIGDKRAEDIIAARPYQSLEDLVELEILTQNLLDDVKNLLIL